MNVIEMIKALHARDVTAKAETAHHAAQRRAWALLDESTVYEPSTGEIIMRMRTQEHVSVPGRKA